MSPRIWVGTPARGAVLGDCRLHPSGGFGLLLHKGHYSLPVQPGHCGGGLVVGGIVILLVERYAHADRVQRIDQMSGKDALLVESRNVWRCFQGFPFRRDHHGGCWAGCHASRRPNFPFLAIPTMFAATFYSLYKGGAV